MKTKIEMFTLKRYGTSDTTKQVFQRRHRMNQRIIEPNLTRDVFSLFKYQNRRALTERKLFEFKNFNIDFLKSVKCYRGIRHKARLPVRGQRTHTNASKKIYKKRRYE